MSVYRISSNTINDNGVFHLRNREYEMDKVNQQINTGKKHRLPKENVVDVTQSMTYHTKIHKIDQYVRNITDAKNERSLSEIKMNDTIQILQRARELAVQGANGTYSADDRKAMAVEVDQMLKAVLTNANSKYKGDYLFSGYQKYTQPFEALEGVVRGADEPMITKVKYLGDNGVHLREIDAGEHIGVNAPGSEVFWADNHQVYSRFNTRDFRITEDQTIMIDTVKIKFNAGDNAYAIMDKINKADVAVTASIDRITGGMILRSTRPHKMEVSDIEGGTLMQDLGILEKGRPIGPDNFDSSVTEFGGTIFDTLIGLRDAMLTNNAEDVGGKFLQNIDESINNLTYNMAKTGSIDNRLTYLEARHGEDKLAFTEALTKSEDVDMAEAISEMRMLDFAQRAALSSLAKLSKTSLMDFI